MKNKIKENAQYILILIATIIICIPLFLKELNIYRDDGIQHICRLIGTFQTITDKEFLPMIMSNFCNNFGYSWNIFYSPLTAYAPLLLKAFNLSFVQCLKTFMFTITLLSGISMYKFTVKVTKNKNIATLAAIIYILEPYRITDMYIRTALAELASFVFIPIVFNGLYTIINEEKKSFLLAWGIIGLVLTHTVVTLYTAIICFIYVIIFIKKLKNRKIIINLIENLLFGLVATSFYWVGLLQHYMATSYEVFVPGRMQRLEVLEYYKIKFSQLFYTSNDQLMIYAIGLITVIGLILTPVGYKKIPNEYKKISISFLVIGLVLLLTTLTFFPFEKLPSVLTMIQFTFRLLEFTSFMFAFVAAVNLGAIIKNFRIRDTIILTLIISLLLIPYKSKIKFGLSYNEEELITPVSLTENTGRVHAGMASLEYLPSKAFNNLDYIVNRQDVPIVLKGDCQIYTYEKSGSNMSMKILNTNSSNETIIELPYTYYLGYRIYANDKEITYMESENGFVQINLTLEDSEEINIKVKYLGTNAMLISYTISFFVMSTFVIILIITKNKERKTK